VSELDPVWRALADPTRREILDLLRIAPRTTTALVEHFPHLSRFAVMKHTEVLRQAGLLQTREEGRRRVHTLNVVPIQQIYERWVRGFEGLWASQLLALKRSMEATEERD